MDNILLNEMIKEYRERKRDWMIAQEEIIKGNENPVYELQQQYSVQFMVVIETLLKRANINIEEMSL